jgi:hypothetical protein
MADAGLFIGWGAPVRGRETKGLDVFNEALAFQGKLQDAGEIESYEVALLGPHGGGLAGFMLVRGSDEQIAALRARDDFQRINTRAAMIVDEFGVVDAALGEGIGEAITQYREAVDDLG